MHVLKFGGTSMADEHTWEQVLSIIGRYEKPVVVVSATARTTRALRRAAAAAAEGRMKAAREETAHIRERHLSLVREFVEAREHPGAQTALSSCEAWIEDHIRELDSLLITIRSEAKLSRARLDTVSSFGERLSSRLIAECGRLRGLPTQHVDARRVIKTNADFGRARPEEEAIGREAELLKNMLDEGSIPVVGGYYGETLDGVITTLGLEGSDYTASLLGAAIDAESVEIWTDVTGIYTSDPRLIKGVRPIEHLDYREAAELAHYGAKVLHPSTIEPAAAQGIPVWVKNMFEPDRAGTRIAAEQEGRPLVKGLAFKEDVSIVRLHAGEQVTPAGFMAEVFGQLNERALPANVIAASGRSVSLAVESERLEGALVQQLERIASVEVLPEHGLVTLVGSRLTEDPDLAGRVFEALADTTVQMIAFGSSPWSFSIAVSGAQTLPAARRLHEAFFPESLRSSINQLSEKASP